MRGVPVLASCPALPCVAFLHEVSVQMTLLVLPVEATCVRPPAEEWSQVLSVCVGVLTTPVEARPHGVHVSMADWTDHCLDPGLAYQSAQLTLLEE